MSDFVMMSRLKRRASFLSALVFFSVLFIITRVDFGNTQDLIYIRADGTIEGTDRIISDNSTYTFNSDLNTSIIVERDNIIIEGANNSLTGLGDMSSTGIELSGRSNVTIKDLSISAFGVCINLKFSLNNKILENRIESLGIGIGIVIQDSSENALTGNQIRNNKEGIRMRGNSSFNQIAQNNLTENAYGLTLNCPNNQIYQNNITFHNTCGVFAFATQNITISDNSICNNKNQSEHGAWGVLIRRCNDTVFDNNNLTDNEIALEMHDSCNNTISANSFVRNIGPFHFDGSDHTISDNSFVNNTDYGIIASLASNCRITRNAFDSNNVHAVQIMDVECFHIAENNITNTQKDLFNRAYSLNIFNMSQSMICRNDIQCNGDCVRVDLCSDSSFLSNTIANNSGPGLYVSGSVNCTFSENEILNNNGAGIKMWYCNASLLTNNTIEKCDPGISLSYSFDNRIFHNRFINNTEQVQTLNSTSLWDDGFPSGGNFWSDYREKYPFSSEIDGSGLWDTPYVIDENNEDNYPIVPELLSVTLLPVLIATTVQIALSRERKRREHFL